MTDLSELYAQLRQAERGRDAALSAHDFEGTASYREQCAELESRIIEHARHDDYGQEERRT